MNGELLERARAGDSRALAELLEALAPAVYRFGRRMCGSGPDAEDVVQETLLSVARKLPEFEGRASLSSWVYAIARSACSHSRRGLKNQAHLPEEAARHVRGQGPDPERAAERGQLARALEEALDGLPPDQREVLWLRDVEGLSAAETADAVGASVAAVKSRLHRARSGLRAALAPVLEPPTEASPGCPEVARLFSQKLEGELDARDCERMEAHLQGCGHCSAACQALQQALAACRNLPESGQEVPESVRRRVQRALGLAIGS